jgi:Tfp pilus assembly protein PilF
MDVDVSYPKAREFAIESITRNSNLAEAYVALAWIQFAYDWKFKESEKNYRKAIKIDPKFAQAYHWLGINLTSQGRFDEAYLNLKKGVELDPGNHVILLNFSVALIELGKYEEAETANKRGLSVNPNYYNNWELLYVNYVRQSSREKDIDDLIDEIEAFINKNRQIYSILLHYYKDKDVKKSNEYLVKLKSYLEVTKSRSLEQYQILDVDFSGFMDRAEEAFETQKLPYAFGNVSTTYYLNEYNDNPRYKALVKKFREGR